MGRSGENISQSSVMLQGCKVINLHKTMEGYGHELDWLGGRSETQSRTARADRHGNTSGSDPAECEDCMQSRQNYVVTVW